MDRAIAAALVEAGALDVVINNAGVAALGVTEAFTPDQFEQFFDVNVYGAIRVNRAADFQRSWLAGSQVHGAG